jgi:hypothetical protein
MRVHVVQYTLAAWFLWDGGALPAASTSSPTIVGMFPWYAASAVTSVGGNSFVSIVLVGGLLAIDFGGARLVSTSPTVVANSWYHVAITRVRGSQRLTTMQMFVNGEAVVLQVRRISV